EMRVKTWHQAFTATFHDARRLVSAFVILEALLGGEAGHADVVTRLAVALRVAQVDDVDMVMVRAFSRARQGVCPVRRRSGSCTARLNPGQDQPRASSSSSVGNGRPSVSSAAWSIRGTRSIGSSGLISSPPLAACRSLNFRAFTRTLPSS